MIHVTERAKELLLDKKLSANLQQREIGLRLAVRPDGHLGLVADREKAGDQVVKHKDSTVLLVDPEMSAFAVTGRTVDCRRAPNGRMELILRRRDLDDPDTSGADAR
jgi:hypothetical protein